MKKPTAKKIAFQLNAPPDSEVSVAGTFNKWDPKKNPMKDIPGSGVFRTVIAIPPGRHEYKFVVNGEWQIDPRCSECVPNGHGSLNSVVCVTREEERRAVLQPA